LNHFFPRELSTVFSHPLALARPKKHIFLLSHMRAYTSLMGHILGSSPLIEGYYEMHVGYYSWRSLVRQKMLYYREHKPKPGARYLFDKILHNDHQISSSVLARQDVFTLLSIREPALTIESIVKHYSKVNPSHQFADPQYAAQYYLSRLNALSQYAAQLSGKYVYMDAEAVTRDAGSTLEQLTVFLNLDIPLSPHYRTMKKTAQGNTGDHSPEISSGSIQNPSSKKPLADGAVATASDSILSAYEKAREICIKNTDCSILVPNATL
jgi:hypothetical protein